MAIAVVGLAIAVPALAQYSADGSPVWRAFNDIRAEVVREPDAVLGMHFAFARASEAEFDKASFLLPAAPKHEWLSLVKYWTGGGREPAWFLEDPRRTDLALVDPRARRTRGAYRWPFTSVEFLSGIRPDEVNWIEMREPGWFAAEGWDLTPETAGVARLDGRSLDRGPIVAWVRRRDEPAVVMIGGRHLGRPGDPAAVFSAAIDGREAERWQVPASPQFFLRFVHLPAGALAGPSRFAKLEVALSAAPGQPHVPAAIEQFDLQPPGVPMLGFDQGWYEPEYNPAAGRLWRWTSPSATARLSIAADVSLTVSGESPLRYFDTAPHVVVRAGDDVLYRAQPAADFTWTIKVSRQSLERSGGTVTIETDRSFRPADRGQGQDRRLLGLRVYRLAITPAS